MNADPPLDEGASRSPRIGLVLGAGGVVGGAFHAGVLAAIEHATGWDPRGADVVVGTSAGSISGSMLRAGVSAQDLLARAQGRPLSAAGQRLLAPAGVPFSPPSSSGPGVARSAGDIAAILLRAAARPFSARPVALIAGLLPEGTIGTDEIAFGVAAVMRSPWPSDPLYVCAVRRRDGRRVVFGRDRVAPLPLAVSASCAIPGFFRSVEIDGDEYIDGGVHSPTNADLLRDWPSDGPAGSGSGPAGSASGPAGSTSGPLGSASGPLDLVIVSSPMSIRGSGLRSVVDQPIRRWARTLLDLELLKLRRRGIPTLALQPAVEDLAFIGPDAMDVERRGIAAARAFTATLAFLTRADVAARLRLLGGAP